jgi:hypothetical protein
MPIKNRVGTAALACPAERSSALSMPVMYSLTRAAFDVAMMVPVHLTLSVRKF